MDTGDNLVPKWAFLALLLIFLLFGVAPSGSDGGPIYLDANAPVAYRVKDLMTGTSSKDQDLQTILLAVTQRINLEAK